LPLRGPMVSSAATLDGADTLPGLETDFVCRVCGAAALDEFTEFGALPRVTSDCKPFPAGGRLAVCRQCAAVQKPVDDRWQAEAAAIYRDYEVYFQSGGVEQAVFDPTTGAPRRRSAVILDRFAANRPLAESGTLLDLGCGNGALLSAFAELRPRWALYGHDLSEINLDYLSRIPSFHRLYTGDIAALPGGFDLITLMHSLEHLPDPVAGLRDIAGKFAAGGALLIEVPDAEATPFDLLVADHVSHFTQADLARVLARAGYRAAALANDWVVKELSVVAVPGEPIATDPQSPGAAAAVQRRVGAQIAWLRALIAAAQEAAARPRFGLFGSSVSAMWLFGELGDAVAFFVDEDPSRGGTELLSRPVLHPRDVPQGATVFVPLIPPVARHVAARWAASGFDLRLPPEVPSH